MRWTVRVVLPHNGLVHPEAVQWMLEHGGRCLAKNTSVTMPRFVWEFPAPLGVDSHAWAQVEAKVLQECGLNAVAAPEWWPKREPIVIT
jgi:hypothetical protein